MLFDWDDFGPLAPERDVAYVLVNPFICPDPAGFLAASRDAGGVFGPSGLEVFATAIAVSKDYLAALVPCAVPGDRRADTELLPMLESPLRISELQALLNVACF